MNKLQRPNKHAFTKRSKRLYKRLRKISRGITLPVGYEIIVGRNGTLPDHAYVYVCDVRIGRKSREINFKHLPHKFELSQILSLLVETIPYKSAPMNFELDFQSMLFECPFCSNKLEVSWVGTRCTSCGWTETVG